MRFLCPPDMNSISVNGMQFNVQDGIVVLPDNMPQRQIEDLETGHGLKLVAAGADLPAAQAEHRQELTAKSEKAKLADQALRRWGINLDRRKSLEAMRIEYAELERRATTPPPAA